MDMDPYTYIWQVSLFLERIDILRFAKGVHYPLFNFSSRKAKRGRTKDVKLMDTMFVGGWYGNDFYGLGIIASHVLKKSSHCRAL